MATVTTMVDDINGKSGAETHTFSVDDERYSVDLTDANFKEFISSIQPYIDAGRQMTGTVHPIRRRRAIKQGSVIRESSSEQLSAIRDWARQNGYEVSNRGRVAAEIRDAFDAAHKKAPSFSHG